MKRSEVKKLDKLWTEKVKEKANNKCEYCGRSNIQLHAHHIFGRAIYALRFDLENGIALCSQHHKFNTKFSAHTTPTRFDEWVFDKRDMGYLDEMSKITDFYCDYEDIIERLE